MSFDNRDSIDFGREKISHLFNELFIPTLLGMVFNVTFILADGIFVGHSIGADGLAAVNLVAPIMMVITGIGMMFGVGSSVVAAIHLAKNKEKTARICVTQAFEASLIIASVVVVVLYLFPYPILKLIGCSDHLLEMTTEYLVWFIPTCLLIMIQLVGEFIVRLDGSPRYAMMANIIPAVVNIVLDYLFLFPLDMGLKGAALATTIGTSFGSGMTIYYVLRLSDKLRLYPVKHTLTGMRLGLRNVTYMMRVGFSGFLSEFTASVIALTGNLAFGRYLGDAGIAAFSVICYLTPVVFNVYYAVSTSAQPIISFNYGADQWDRVRKAFVLSLKVNMLCAVMVTVLVCLFPSDIISVFLKRDCTSFTIACKGLPLQSLSFLLAGFNLSVIGYYQGTERNIISTLLVSLRGIVLVIITFRFLPLLMGEIGLWTAVPLAELLTALLAVVFIYHDRTQWPQRR